MALTGMQIYKLLPKTNCKDCGFPTCMAFAMQVAAKQKAITDCPHLSDEAQASLSEASAPPIKLIKVGTDSTAFEMGQETVMFRHEEKFHRETGIAVKVAASLSDDDAKKKIDAINKSSFLRVGEEIKVRLCAVEIDGVSDPAARAKLAADTSSLPLILMGSDAAAMKKAAEAIKDKKPLLYRAEKSNFDGFVDAAASLKLPLVVYGETLEEMAELTAKAKEKGAEDLVLGFDPGEKLGDAIRNLTIARRAALRQNFRALGYPVLVHVSAGSQESETVRAGMFAAKYAGIVIIEGVDAWELLPIMATIQNVYTDPQVPNTVEAKLYEIGNTTENSPVLFTTNFSLTYFSVESEVERSKIPTYICVVETEGLGVLNAYAGDKISAEKVVKTLNDQKVKEKVKHNKLIIPGLLPIFRAEIEDTSEWKEVIIGPENARDIPGFLTSTWKS
jgi:acetyl-CoA decarbonylase/synthase complex subunit gamma